MSHHWIVALIFTTSIAAYAAIMWILLGVARHFSHRITIMMDTRYGFRDAGVLLMRKARQETGPAPGRHRAIEPLQPTRVELTGYVPENDPGNFYYKPPAGGDQHVVLGDPLTVPEQGWPPPSPLRAIDDPANTVVLRVGDRDG